MATPYSCHIERRRNAVDDHPVLNGIDFLEVLDSDAPADSPPQRTLLVRLLKTVPADLTVENLRISGGVRITNIQFEWAIAAAEADNAFANGLISEIERDFFLDQTDPFRLLLARTTSSGDYSTYSFHIVSSSSSHTNRADFDPIRSEVAFSFKVECPSEFDCENPSVCPPQLPESPPIDYLAKDYGAFRQLMFDRLSVIMPEWKERNPADLGVAIVETMSYAADELSYQQDSAATENYLGTARRRVSVRRHARLLDYPMHDGVNARLWVCMEVDAAGDGAVFNSIDDTGFIPRFMTRMPESPLIDPANWERVLARHHPDVFEPITGTALYEAHNEIVLHTWSDEGCCLPSNATCATLRDDETARLRLRTGDVLIFEEVRSPSTGRSEDADPARRHAVRLETVVPEAVLNADGRRTPDPTIHRDPVTQEPIVEISWSSRDALPIPLCLSARINGHMENDLSIARGNVILADSGRTLPIEPLPPMPKAKSIDVNPRYRPRLSELNITHRVPFDHTKVEHRSATEDLEQDPRAAIPAITLSGMGETWVPQRDLLASGRFANEFVVEMEDDGRATIRFGDGVFGRKPSSDLAATYRIGTGSEQNVGAEALAHVVTSVPGITRIRNPMSATGGRPKESRQEVRLYAPQAFRIQERAVTEVDYAVVARRHPEVQRAFARRRWTGSWFTMFLSIDRMGGLPVDGDFERELREFLEQFRLAGQDLEIDGPHFVALDIAFTVCVAPRFFRSDIKAALFERFSASDLADGRRGYFHPDRFTFGQRVFLSPIIAEAMDISGVQWIDAAVSPGKPNRFQRWGNESHGEYDLGFIEIDAREIARLDNDPSRPENGKIEFFMKGGL